MADAHPRSIEVILSQLAEEDRAGLPVASVAATWRFACVVDPEEVAEWVDVGVFDGHRAGLLKAAGIGAEDLVGLPSHGQYTIGFAYATGELSLDAVIAMLDAIRTTFPRRSRSVRARPRSHAAS